jgi:hypothetical protein
MSKFENHNLGKYSPMSFISRVLLLVNLFTSCTVAAGGNEIVNKSNSTTTVKKRYQPGALYKTTYKGKVVYFSASVCCDIPSNLVDANGKLICYPNGGFISVYERCPDFKFDRSQSVKVEGLPDYMQKKKN